MKNGRDAGFNQHYIAQVVADQASLLVVSSMELRSTLQRRLQARLPAQRLWPAPSLRQAARPARVSAGP